MNAYDYIGAMVNIVRILSLPSPVMPAYDDDGAIITLVLVLKWCYDKNGARTKMPLILSRPA